MVGRIENNEYEIEFCISKKILRKKIPCKSETNGSQMRKIESSEPNEPNGSQKYNRN